MTTEDIKLSFDELKILGSCLGINVYHAKQSTNQKDKKLPKEFYRNRFCCNTEEHSDYSVLKELEKCFIVERWLTENNQLYFFVTDFGIKCFRNEFEKQI